MFEDLHSLLASVSLTALLAFVLDAIAIVRAITRDHGVERTLAWIFAIIALPVVGALAYLVLASPSVGKIRRRKRLASFKVRDDHNRLSEYWAYRDEIGDEGILRLAAHLTDLMPSKGNRARLLAEDTDAFRRMRDAVNAAEKSVWAEYYIIKNDETGKEFLDLLARKAEEGVEVRLLYDALGSMEIDEERLEAIDRAGGRVSDFLPMNPLRGRWSVHLRNHRKLIVIDGKTGYTGGMNVGDEYSGRSRRKGMQYFHDTHLEIEGPAVADMSLAFAEDWKFATGQDLEPPPDPPPFSGGGATVSVVTSGPDDDFNANCMVFFAGIASARSKVYLTSPYFIPDEPTLRALLSAAMRGVDARVMVPKKSDVRLVGAAAKSYYRRLLMGGVRVYEYTPSMLHGKTMAVDGKWGVVGSANLDIRSFRLNFELGALVHDESFAGVLEERFLGDIGKCHEVTIEDIDKRWFVERIVYGVARLLSPLL